MLCLQPGFIASQRGMAGAVLWEEEEERRTLEAG